MHLTLRNTLLGDTFSTFGAWVDFITILTVAAYSFHVNPYQMAIIGTAGLLPPVILNKLIGKIVSNGITINVLKFSLLLRVIITLCIMISSNLYIFIILVSVRSIFNGVTIPAVNVLSARYLHNVDNTTSYYSILNIVNSLSKILAPLLGSLATSIYSPKMAFILSTILAMISFYFFSKLKEPNKVEKITPKPELENISNIPSKTKSILFLSCVFCYFFFVFMLNNQLPLILKMLDFNSALLGTLISCSGCGNVLSGSFSALCGKKYPMKGNLYELVLPGLLTALGFGVVALALYFIKIHTVLILCLIFFIIGIASARFSIATNVFTIKKFEHNIGVVSSQIQAVQNTAILFAPLLGAYILSNYTPKVLFLFASIIGIISFILIMISYKIQLRCKAS